MLISFNHRFIFVHVYKVAGSSIKAALRPYAWNPRATMLNRLARRLGIPGRLPFDRHLCLSDHVTAAEIKGQYSASVFEQSYKFAFVRNPWDWQVSLYHYMIQQRDHRQHDLIRSLGSFDAYIEWRVEKDLQLQKEFVTDEEGKLIVDFVGRYESLQEDFQKVCRNLGIKATLPHLNSSRRAAYSQYYSERSAERIAEAFKEDIDLFGYTFDEGSGYPPSEDRD